MNSEYRRKPRILVADDDDTFRSLVVKLLEGEGHLVTEAVDGESAITEGRQHEFDVIMLDVKMPKADGMDVLRVLKPESPFTEFLMITGHQDIKLAVEAMKLGAKEYLAKPIPPEDLLARLSSVIRAHFAEQDLKALQTQFSSRMLYEIRTPVHSVETALGVLLKQSLGALTDQQHDILKQAATDINRVLKLVNDMIDLTKLEAGSVALERIPTNLDDLVPAICHQMEPRMRDKKIALSLTIGKSIPTIPVDQEKIEQVIVNLLDNAIKHTNEQGTIGVDVATRQKDMKGAFLEFVEIAIADSGSGIPPDELPYLFDKYKEFITGKTSKKKSTGLGLAICKNIIEAHRGRLEAESQVGKGSTFRVLLPTEPL